MNELLIVYGVIGGVVSSTILWRWAKNFMRDATDGDAVWRGEFATGVAIVCVMAVVPLAVIWPLALIVIVLAGVLKVGAK